MDAFGLLINHEYKLHKDFVYFMKGVFFSRDWLNDEYGEYPEWADFMECHPDDEKIHKHLELPQEYLDKLINKFNESATRFAPAKLTNYLFSGLGDPALKELNRGSWPGRLVISENNEIANFFYYNYLDVAINRDSGTKFYFGQADTLILISSENQFIGFIKAVGSKFYNYDTGVLDKGELVGDMLSVLEPLK